MAIQRGRNVADPDYGIGEHEIDCGDLEYISEVELTERLSGAMKSPNYRPPRLPQVAMELMTLSAKPDVQLREIERLLEQDAMLTGEVLSVSRSAYYSRGGPTSSLHEALQRVGTSKLRQIVMQAAMELRVFRSKSYQACIERLKDHSRATAHVARLIAGYSSIDDEQSFLCGLLHDVGIAGILLVLGDAAKGKSPPDLQLLWPAIHGAHAVAGVRMVELWGLPPEIGLAVGAHHNVCIDGFDHPLAAAICLAECLTLEMDKGLVPRQESAADQAAARAAGLPVHAGIDQSSAPAVERARRALSIDDRQLELIRKDAKDWAASAE